MLSLKGPQKISIGEFALIFSTQMNFQQTFKNFSQSIYFNSDYDDIQPTMKLSFLIKKDFNFSHQTSEM